MYLPTIETLGPNYCALYLSSARGDTLKIWYSYKTPIAYALNGTRTVRVNDWAQTTGRHLSAIDGGSKEAKRERIPGDQFERALADACDALAGHDARASFILGPSREES